MKNNTLGIPYSFRRRLILLSGILVLSIILACSFLPAVGTSTTAEPQGSTNLATQTNVAGPDPLDRLLDMRLIQFSLTSEQPDGTSRSVQGDIDSAGNMHLKFHAPVALPPDLPADIDPTLQLPEDTEAYVVDGKAYQPDSLNPAWMTTPVDEDYKADLSQWLHGPDGPGLWLDILPDGSLQSAGQETMGGFAADKYAVNGKVGEQTITGNLWYKSHAMVRAELHIPAALISDPTAPAQGELKITLAAQTGSVPPVILPTAPAGAASSTNGLPSDVPLYPGATNVHDLSGQGTTFDTTDQPDQVAAFYRQQMVAAGWVFQDEEKSGTIIMQSWQKADRTATIHISENAGKTTVLIMLVEAS